MHLSDLKHLPVTELVDMAIADEIDNASRMRKQDLIFAILKHKAKKVRAYLATVHWKYCKMALAFCAHPTPLT